MINLCGRESKVPIKLEVYLADGGFVTIHDRGLLNASVINSVVGVSGHLEPGVILCPY